MKLLGARLSPCYSLTPLLLIKLLAGLIPENMPVKRHQFNFPNSSYQKGPYRYKRAGPGHRGIYSQWVLKQGGQATATSHPSDKLGVTAGVTGAYRWRLERMGLVEAGVGDVRPPAAVENMLREAGFRNFNRP